MDNRVRCMSTLSGGSGGGGGGGDDDDDDDLTLDMKAPPAPADQEEEEKEESPKDKKKKKKGKKGKKGDEEDEKQEAKVGYYERKKLAKEHRKEVFLDRLAKKERLVTRRLPIGQEPSPTSDGSTGTAGDGVVQGDDGNGAVVRRKRGYMKEAFMAWHTPRITRNYIWQRRAKQAKMPWKINVAAIVERPNVVLPDYEDWQNEYLALRSYLHQYRVPQYPKEFEYDYTINWPYTPEQYVEKVRKDGMRTILPRETPDDDTTTGNTKTHYRRLKGFLYLLVQNQQQQARGQLDGHSIEDALWHFPTVHLENEHEETLLDAAKRAVREQVGSSLQLWAPYNHPAAVRVTVYDEKNKKKISNDDGDGQEQQNGQEQEQQNGQEQEQDNNAANEQQEYYGCKTFFMKLEYSDGDVNESETTVQDFAWLDKQELLDHCIAQSGQPYEHNEWAQFYRYLLMK